MLEIYNYFIVVFFSIGIPLIIIWSVFFRLLLKYKRIFLYTSIGSFIFGGMWDYVAFRCGVWNWTNIVGIWFLGLPLEEWFFIFTMNLFITSIALIFLQKGERRV